MPVEQLDAPPVFLAEYYNGEASEELVSSTETPSSFELDHEQWASSKLAENDNAILDAVEGVSDREITFGKRAEGLFELDQVIEHASYGTFNPENNTIQFYLSPPVCEQLHPEFFAVLEITDPQYIITARCDEEGNPTDILEAKLLIGTDLPETEHDAIDEISDSETFSFSNLFRYEGGIIKIFDEGQGIFVAYKAHDPSNEEIVKQFDKNYKIIEHVLTEGQTHITRSLFQKPGSNMLTEAVTTYTYELRGGIPYAHAEIAGGMQWHPSDVPDDISEFEVVTENGTTLEPEEIESFLQELLRKEEPLEELVSIEASDDDYNDVSSVAELATPEPLQATSGIRVELPTPTVRILEEPITNTGSETIAGEDTTSTIETPEKAAPASSYTWEHIDQELAPTIQHLSAQVIEIENEKTTSEKAQPDAFIAIQALVRIPAGLAREEKTQKDIAIEENTDSVEKDSGFQLKLQVFSPLPAAEVNPVTDEISPEAPKPRKSLYYTLLPVSVVENQTQISHYVPITSLQPMEAKNPELLEEVEIFTSIVPSEPVDTLPIDQISGAEETKEVITSLRVAVPTKPPSQPDQLLKAPLPQLVITTPVTQPEKRMVSEAKTIGSKQETKQWKEEKDVVKISATEATKKGAVIYSAPIVQVMSETHRTQEIVTIERSFREILQEKSREKSKPHNSGRRGSSNVGIQTKEPQAIALAKPIQYKQRIQQHTELAAAEVPTEVARINPAISIIGLSALSVVQQAQAKKQARDIVQELSRKGNRPVPARFVVSRVGSSFDMHQKAA